MSVCYGFIVILKRWVYLNAFTDTKLRVSSICNNVIWFYIHVYIMYYLRCRLFLSEFWFFTCLPRALMAFSLFYFSTVWSSSSAFCLFRSFDCFSFHSSCSYQSVNGRPAFVLLYSFVFWTFINLLLELYAYYASIEPFKLHKNLLFPFAYIFYIIK